MMSSLPHVVWFFLSVILPTIIYFLFGRKLEILELDRGILGGICWLGWNYLSVSSSFIFVSLLLLYQKITLPPAIGAITKTTIMWNSSFMSMMWLGIVETHVGYITICIIAALPSIVMWLGIVTPRRM